MIIRTKESIMHRKTKGNQFLFTPPRISINEEGQLTLFFAVSVIVVVTLIAFVVNIGLFVKAKINLQNAVDAAAWSGAATQARQLTDIAYLNWEMRNVYKEWMFKYYVLGNRSSRGVKTPGTTVNPQYPVKAPNGMDFTVYSPLGSNIASNVDRYNIPSICLFLGTSQNAPDLCSIYSTPGLPVFNQPWTGGINETFSRMNDAIAKEVSNDCNARTTANLLVALNWAFGVGDIDQTSPLSANAPQLAINRPGAWPSAMEIAFRIRNLESMVNLAPESGGICKNAGTANCTRSIDSLEQINQASFERPIKAFYSGFRNLGNEFDREMKESFVLTEIPPKAVSFAGNENLSNLLIPEKEEFRKKRYLDLKLILLNFTSFYTMLTTISEPGQPGRVSTDAKCYQTKVGIPVPGYPMGFEKNTSVLTYYAVKGEAQFIGLFNPFKSPITLTAYAAAKPFGGRIGPKLFDTQTSDSAIFPRWEGNKRRSSAYIFGIDITGANNQTPSSVNKGRPVLPDEPDFWLANENDVIGGFKSGTSGAKLVKYGIPNLPYDPKTLNSDSINTPEKIFIYKLPSDPSKGLNRGLYNVEDFVAFQSNIQFGAPGTVTPESAVLGAIDAVRAPTTYEARNYLIPSVGRANSDLKNDSFGYPGGILRIYAPLYGTGFPNTSSDEVLGQIRLYLVGQKASIEVYEKTLENIAEKYRKMDPQSTTAQAGDIYGAAADKIHDGNSPSGLSCASMAGQFKFFFLGEGDSGITNKANCPSSMWDALSKLYTATITGGAPSSNALEVDFYKSKIQYKGGGDDIEKIKQFFSAYIPGPLTGGSNGITGEITNPFRAANGSSISLRNFYSTKLISIRSLTSGQQGYMDPIQAIYSEGSADDLDGVNFAKGETNPLDIGSVSQISPSEIFQ